MKLSKNYLDNLSSSTYKEYMKLLPSLGKSSAHGVTTIIFTIGALIVFGLFAISPTINTIVTLRKQLEDSRVINEQLKTKIQNLNSLQKQYKQISPELPVLFDALPASPEATMLAGQIGMVLSDSHLQIDSLHIAQVQLAPAPPRIDTGTSFSFSLQAEGPYANMLQFTSALSRISRLTTVENLTITKDAQKNILLLHIEGKAYFKT